MVLGVPEIAAPTDPAAMARLQAQYFGMISEVDAQLGRVWEHLRGRGMWDDTVVVVTADHGEQLGDQGLMQKLAFFESSYTILGIVRDPRRPGGHGTVVERFTENVDIVPTMCEAMGLEVPAQCDGYPLTPFLDGVEPDGWRDAAHYEWDWRDVFIGRGEHPWPWDRRLERQHLAVLRVGRPRLRAVRRRLVAVLRPRRRPDVADRGRRPGASCSPTPRRCWCGARSTPSARSPTCCCATAASAASPPASPAADRAAGSDPRPGAHPRFGGRPGYDARPPMHSRPRTGGAIC